MTFYRVVLPHYCCGFWVKNGLIVDGAPIILSHWRLASFMAYKRWVKSKGGYVHRMRD